jgi:type II secretory pathway component PulF
MPIYHYTAIDGRGRRVTGDVHATDPDHAIEQLGHMELRVERIVVAEMKPAEKTPVDPAPETSAPALHRVGRMSESDAQEIAGHIAGIEQSGLPLESGLAAIAAELDNKRVARVLKRLVRDLEGGVSLETALAQSKAPGHLKALIRAGARTGATPLILEQYAETAAAVAAHRGTFLRAIAYPLVLLLLCTAFTLVFTLVVAPGFIAVLELQH